jgi:diguanylate cyclase (GGDEF)-like protein
MRDVAVSYAQALSTDVIVAEIESLLDWRNQILRECFFPGSQAKASDPQAPSALMLWCRREADRGTVERRVAERMAFVHEELCKSARQVLLHSATGAQPTLELYDAFEAMFENFITHIRRLQQDVADTAAAVDPVTGLRTVSGMRNDLQREQDRFDRKGASYCIASIEIDRLEELQQKLDRRSQDAVYATVAQVIAKAVRSFDDAYYLGKGEYLVVLKHVEFMDACAVMDRLRATLEATPIFLPNAEKTRVTVSLGVAEAQQREAPDVAIEHAKKALTEAKAAGGNRVEEYREVSALAQYVRETKKDGF